MPTTVWDDIPALRDADPNELTAHALAWMDQGGFGTLGGTEALQVCVMEWYAWQRRQYQRELERQRRRQLTVVG